MVFAQVFALVFAQLFEQFFEILFASNQRFSNTGIRSTTNVSNLIRNIRNYFLERKKQNKKNIKNKILKYFIKKAIIIPGSSSSGGGATQTHWSPLRLVYLYASIVVAEAAAKAKRRTAKNFMINNVRSNKVD